MQIYEAIFIGLLFISPATVLRLAIAKMRIHAEKSKISFGLQELHLIPVVLIPSFLFAALVVADGRGVLGLLLLVVYQVSGGILGWTRSYEPTGGWRSALGLLTGALSGALFLLLVLAIFVLIIAIVGAVFIFHQGLRLPFPGM